MARALGDPDGLRLLTSLVAISPTNLEDPVAGRYEKGNYARAAGEIVRWARRFGLSTRIFDPLVDLPPDPEYRGIARPNVIVDWDAGSKERVLLLAHYDVVPVPNEQLGRWKSPPHALTERSDGRLYGRGANDDLGSGVVASLLAMKRLAQDGKAPRSVRLLVCCDEETGGLGGIEAMKIHDERLPPHHPDRFVEGDVALIPDGGPHATAGSSGVMFLDAVIEGPAAARNAVELGAELARLHEFARSFRSAYPSPDWPDHGAPESVLTGRATVTRFDLETKPTGSASVTVLRAHAENDAPNQIAEAVTLVVGGPEPSVGEFLAWATRDVPPPYRVATPAAGTSLVIPPGAGSFQVVGLSAHGGYPHRGHNPVGAALALLDRALREHRIDEATSGRATFSVDFRLIPEMAIDEVRGKLFARLEHWNAVRQPRAQFDAPPTRARGGYAAPLDHPAVRKLERLLRDAFGEGGVFGEYGGTDASTLVGITTPSGAPLPALVFGSMDRDAHIHEAEESVDPRMIAKVSETIERFAREP
ncbi:MAG: M20/M25/M40 family metallo-hydrolase [Thermoplasmata archaeon]|nr:M20/M25/M40 family metallo-hydrolase [Thermoplasmata archaeon]